ncbi:MAG: hypothetical protein F4X57_11700 [Chloroflexi bacterium]|nr:hypothetical protein [Chloroflexota bacterium]
MAHSDRRLEFGKTVPFLTFIDRPLGGRPYCYVWLNALTQNMREDGGIVNVSVRVFTSESAGPGSLIQET